MCDDLDTEEVGGHTTGLTAGQKIWALPIAMLTRVLGSENERFREEPALCVFIRVKSEEWIQPLISAARAKAKWHLVVEGDGNARTHERTIRDLTARLVMGDRVLIVATDNNALGTRLLPHTDMVLQADSIAVADVENAIEVVTGTRPPELVASDLIGIDLAAAMASIRSGTTPDACLQRIRGARKATVVDPLVQSAVPLEALHGYGAAKIWGERLVADLERWRAGEISLSAIERNVVLAGPPGVGKSTFVRSLGKSARLPLIVSSMGTLFASTSGYLDSVVKGIDALFYEARSAGPAALLFIDELEGFPSRSGLEGRHASWWTPVVNHLLTSLDSNLSPAASNLIVIGATNHPDRLDSALTRRGRLDRVIWIDPPDEESLQGIFRQHLGSDLVGERIDEIVEVAIGATGADVEGFIKSARARARSEGRTMRRGDVIAEICPPSTLSESETWRACVHECGHAVATLHLGQGTIRSIAITAAEGSGGRIAYSDAPSLAGEQSIRNLVIRLLAGRAAEEVLLGTVSSGAGGALDSDLAKATRVMAAARFSWALKGSLLHLATPEHALDHARRSPEALAAIDGELGELYREAVTLIKCNAGALLHLAGRLKEERVLAGARLQQLLEELKEHGQEEYSARADA
jgi:ATP-dependent Zn protease